MNKAYSAPGINKSTSLKGLKFVSLNINGIGGKKLELLAFLDYQNKHKNKNIAFGNKEHIRIRKWESRFETLHKQ